MPILADTSVWVDHVRMEEVVFGSLLRQRGIVLHPFVVGELALGHLARFETMIKDLRDLPQAPVASAEEVLQLIKLKNLSGSGVGYVDAHLLASTLIMPDVRLWTRDKKLRAVAERLSISAAMD